MAKPLKNVAVVALMLILGAAWSGCPKLPNMEGVGFSCAADRPCAQGYVCSCPTGGTCRPAGTAPGPSGCLDVVEGSDVEADVLTDSEKGDADALSCDGVLTTFNGHDYRSCSWGRKWAGARVLCEGIGMNLVQPNGGLENEHVTKMLNEASLSAGVWLDHDKSSLPVDAYTSWGDDQPSDVGNCVLLQGGGEWKTVPCDSDGELYSFICESKEPICGDGIINGGDECDDGNDDDWDECRNNCQLTWVLHSENLLDGSIAIQSPMEVSELDVAGVTCLKLINGLGGVWASHPVAGADRYLISVKLARLTPLTLGEWSPVASSFLDELPKPDHALKFDIGPTGVDVREIVNNDATLIGELDYVTNINEWHTYKVGIDKVAGSSKLWIDDSEVFSWAKHLSSALDGDGILLEGADTCWTELQAYYPAHECGNGVVEAEDGEECDDGNSNELDSCTSQCKKTDPGGCFDIGDFGGQTYTLCPTLSTHGEARDLCEGIWVDSEDKEVKKTLFQPDSDEEEYFVLTEMAKLGVNDSWISMNVSEILNLCPDPSDEGECSIYTHWSDTKPDGNGQCVITRSQGWSNEYCDSADHRYGFVCETIETCADEPCAENEACTDTDDDYSCDCAPGYEYNGPDCVDIDECLSNANNDCEVPDICMNTPGGFYCAEVSETKVDCAAWLATEPSLSSGEYLVDPDGAGVGTNPFEVHCDMTLDGGGWTEIANNDGAATFDPKYYETGLNFEPPGGGAPTGDYVFPCTYWLGLPEPADVVVRVRMGNVTDFFRPGSGEVQLCEMLQTNSKHSWWFAGALKWETPDYYDGDGLGGSAQYWPYARDGRKFLSFWGATDFKGGCCGPAYDATYFVGEPFYLSIKAIKGDPDFPYYGAAKADCQEWLETGPPGLKSGFYYIDPPANDLPFKVYCDMESDGGGWTEIAKNDGKVQFFTTEYTSGFPKDGAGNYALPCAPWLNLPDGTGQETYVLRVHMGGVTDFFAPSPNFCDMLLHYDKHLWWAEALDEWVQPNYNAKHLGGSAPEWPKDQAFDKPDDNRKFLSFWGMEDEDGGCCVQDYKYAEGGAGLPFILSIKRVLVGQAPYPK